MRSLILVLVLAVQAQAQAILPSVPVPPPPPAPKPIPGAAVTLTPDLVYVIRSDTPMIVLASPDGILSIDPQAGPQTVRGKFVEAPGKTVTKKFAEKYLYFVEPASTGRSEVLVVPVGATDAKTVQRRLIDSQLAPQPPPVPPEPVPPVPPSPSPIPSDRLRVLAVYESAATLTDQQTGVLRSVLIQEAVKQAGGEWRVWDKDINVDVPGVDPFWVAAMKRARTSLPWVILSSPKGFYEGPLPASVNEMIALVKKVGG